MKCDKDMGHINQKTDVDVPSDWCKVFREARKKPNPFNVVEMKGEDFFENYLRPLYKSTCPV